MDKEDFQDSVCVFGNVTVIFSQARKYRIQGIISKKYMLRYDGNSLEIVCSV